MMKNLKALFLFLLVFSLTVVHIQADDDERAARCVSVWYQSTGFSGSFNSIMDNAELIDEVNPFWYMPAPDGSLIVLPDAEDVDKMAAWREADMLILPSIFGSVSDVVRSARRDAHIDSIVQTVLRMDYDGIDIDYEGFPANSRDDFSVFIEDLADALHAEGRLLSVTVHAKTNEGVYEGALAQDWPRLIAAGDIFRIMTYDYTSRNRPPGPIAPYWWVLDVLAYAETTTDDMSKVRVGLHFYGYSWQRGTPPATTVTYSGIRNYINNFNLEIYRDDDDMEAYIDFNVPGLPRQVVYFADPVALAHKLDIIHEEYPDIGGVSIWGIGGEHPGLWDTLRAATAGCV